MTFSQMKKLVEMKDRRPPSLLKLGTCVSCGEKKYVLKFTQKCVLCTEVENLDVTLETNK